MVDDETMISFLVKWIPCWLILLAPLFMFPSPTRALALLTLPLLWFLQKREKGYFVPRTPYDWPILFILFMVLVSLYATFDIQVSLRKLTGILFHIVVFYAVVEASRKPSGLSWSLILFFGLGLAVAGVGLIGTQWLYKNPFLNRITNHLPLVFHGLPGAEAGFAPNQVAGTLLWVFPLLFSLLWEFGLRSYPRELLFEVRHYLWLVLGIIGVTFLLTQSRSGWLGGLAALGLIGAVRMKWVRWATLIGGIAAVLFGAIIGWARVAEFLFSDPVQSTLGSFNTLNFRLEVWRAAFWTVADFPFTGIGLDTFKQVVRILYPLNVTPTFEVVHPHNHFLQVAVDLGFLGLVAYLALWLGSGQVLLQVLRQAEAPLLRAIALGVAGSLTGYFVYGLADAIALGAKPGFFFWWLLGLSVGVYFQSFPVEEKCSV